MAVEIYAQINRPLERISESSRRRGIPCNWISLSTM